MSQENYINVPVGIQTEEEKMVEEVQRNPRVHLENVEIYKVAVVSMREELIELVKQGSMTEQVAERLINDFMFTTFNQLVKLKFE